jgi:Fe-S cluster assembly iron-binding protein IscA
MLTISETAREQFKEVMKEYPDKILRVVFEGFG